VLRTFAQIAYGNFFYPQNGRRNNHEERLSMKGKTLNYTIAESEILEYLCNNHTWVLATCKADHVTARSLSFVNIGLELYFQTDTRSTKYSQMINNPNVALCHGNYQIEGKAEELGHPLSPEFADIIDLYRRIHPNAFERYSSYKNEVLFKVKPSKITIWKYIDFKPYRDFIDIENKQATRIEYTMD
jgi:hypothetical protein